MTEEQITDRMAQMIRVGFVNARQPEKMRVKVTIPDTTGGQLITDFLPVLCPRACEDMQYDLPDVGDQVLCLFLSYGLEQGFVIGAMYGKHTPPVQSGDKWHRKFKDGTYLEYDREQHKLVADVKGDVEITTTGSITGKVEQDLSAEVQGSMSASSEGPASISSKSQLSLDSPSMNMGGGDGGSTSASMQGTFTLTRGDMIAETVSLRHHVHICTACGAKTTPPVGGDGGSSEGGGGGSGGGDDKDSSGESGDKEPAGSGNNETSGGNTESGNNEENEGNKDIYGISGLELTPEMTAALAKTGFSWTETYKEEFEKTKKEVHLADNEVFDTILCLPTIAKEEARSAGCDNRLGWLYLKLMFEKWLSGKANKNAFANPDPFWVSMNWALSYYRVKVAWSAITRIPYLNTENAQKTLFNSIEKAELVTDKPEEFKFCEKDWYFWKLYYFQRILVPGMLTFPPDGLMAAMGDFDLRALADGIITPTSTGYHIKVNKICLFIWDSFNFDSYQAMEYWSCPHKSFQGLDPDEAVYLYNSDFRAFQEKIGRGNDFLVLSEPKIVDGFKGYEYDIKI